MPQAQTVGLALVGCGQIANAHLEAAAALPQVRLCHTEDNDPDAARRAAERFGAPRWSSHYQQVLEDDQVDAVILCLPHDLHLPFTLEAAQAGKHILVEKPMALDESESQQMVAAAQAHGVQLSVGQSTRCMPAYQLAHHLLRQGRIGPVHHVLHQRAFYIEKLSTSWRRTQACGGLYLPLFGSHDVDALLWLLEDTPSRVWGSIRAVSPASEGDSDGFIGLDFADGKLASIAFSTTSRRDRTEMIFAGAEGTLSITRSKVMVDAEEVAIDRTEPAFQLQLRLFAEALLAGREVPASGRQVLPVMRVLDLVRHASETGRAQAF
ncbi:MAG: hypothetical protein GKR89_10400 [Candidatus Latescibacteria bacterium]|nr:hypothetical protein [Candidatus Latescibacterota bacterium]